jgi:hypothetical protein
MNNNIESYDTQIERLINTFQAFLISDGLYTATYIDLISPEHLQYFLNFVNKLNSQIRYSHINYRWELFSPMLTSSLHIPYFYLKIELRK